ncbi:MAG: ATP-binding cassette domain-containing protein [Propionibacteriaceae bacterium]|nr:ATP-binding cassette domain-containing protein [Propionibacteriaceae bacterium]
MTTTTATSTPGAPSGGAAPKLELRHVTKTFFPYSVNERTALDDVSLTMADGDFVTVIGSNGAGKSTLLSVVAGVFRPERGQVFIDGRDVTHLPEHSMARLVGRVFQDPMAGTAPDLTIEENMALAWHRGRRRGLGRGVTAAKRARFRDELAVMGLGLENRLTTQVGYLSGGQRQALSLIMAVFSRPSILLLDEHTAALDPARAELITRITEQEVASHRLTTLMVTHNMDQALRLGNRLILMHEGTIHLELTGQEKQTTTVDGLLDQFARRTGDLAADRTLLG